MIDRMDRISRQLKIEISSLIQTDINDPRVEHVTITDVRVSRDLRSAKVYCVLSVDDKHKQKILKGLRSSSRYIRSELAKRLPMKFYPKLIFLEDTSENKKSSLDDIYRKLEEEREEGSMKIFIPDTDIIKKILEAVEVRDGFLITAHINPEGDSIGSQLAIYHMLTKMGKDAIIVNHHEIPENLRFLYGSDKVSTEIPEDISDYNVIVLDCPVKQRTGKVFEALKEGQFVINIDHHVSNDHYGNISWVEPAASSTGEMIYYLIEASPVEIDKDMAESLYSAIVTDTGMFNYSNTTKVTHKVAGDLIEIGVNPKHMHTEIFEKRSLPEVLMLGRVLNTVELEESGRIAHISLTADMYPQEEGQMISTDDFINFPRSIKGVEISVFFKENPSSPGKINVSFRSAGKIDVNRVASLFGGGGHPKASGCLMECGMSEAKEEILSELRKALETVQL